MSRTILQIKDTPILEKISEKPHTKECLKMYGILIKHKNRLEFTISDNVGKLRFLWFKSYKTISENVRSHPSTKWLKKVDILV